MERFAERLKQAMGMNGLNVVELAEKTGVNKGSISHYLLGDYEPKVGRVYQLAEALGVSVEWLEGADVPMHGRQIVEAEDLFKRLSVAKQSMIVGLMQSLLAEQDEHGV